MDLSHLGKKLLTLGYDPPGDYLSSFNELVLRLEEEQLKNYSSQKLDKFKSSKGNEFNKLLKTYLNDIKLKLQDDFFNGNHLKDDHKLYVLNKLLNMSIASKYNEFLKDNKITDSSTDLKHEYSHSTENYHFLVNKLNLLLEKLNLPLLNINSKPSEVKSAVELYLKLYESDKPDVNNNSLQNADFDNNSLHNLLNNSDFESEFTKGLRTMYTDDLCKLQSEIIWLTKEFSNLSKDLT